MIVGAEKIQSGIEQARLLQAKKNRIGAVIGAKATRAQALVRLAWVFFLVGQSDFQSTPAAALKHAQNISRLRNFPTRDGIQKIKQPFQSLLFRSRRRRLNQPLRGARFVVAFAEARVLQREAPVVVKCRAPKQRAVSHHAARDASLLDGMALPAASSLGHAEIAGVYEAHELDTLAFEKGVCSCGIGASVFAVAPPFIGKTRLHVGREFDSFNLLLIVAGLSRPWVPTMTSRAGEANSIFVAFDLLQCLGRAVLVHRLDLRVTRHAAFGPGHFLALCNLCVLCVSVVSSL